MVKTIDGGLQERLEAQYQACLYLGREAMGWRLSEVHDEFGGLHYLAMPRYMSGPVEVGCRPNLGHSYWDPFVQASNDYDLLREVLFYFCDSDQLSFKVEVLCLWEKRDTRHFGGDKLHRAIRHSFMVYEVGDYAMATLKVLDYDMGGLDG